MEQLKKVIQEACFTSKDWRMMLFETWVGISAIIQIAFLTDLLVVK